MPHPTVAAAKPAGSIADRIERFQSPKSNDSEGDTELQQKVRMQANLLQELVASFRASEDMRLLTTQRNKQLAEENKRLKDNIQRGSFDSASKKEANSPAQMSTAEVSTLSMKPSSIGSTVTFTKEQMSELADSVTALKEVAFRRECTWERMAQRQVLLQKQIKTLKDAAMLADRQLRDGARTIKDQAAASKRDQSTIASLKRQVHRLSAPQRPDRKSSVVEVMAPPGRRATRPGTPADAVVAMLAGCRTPTLHIGTPGSRGSSRREHDRRDRCLDRDHIVDKLGLYVDKTGHVLDKGGLYVDKTGHIVDNGVLYVDKARPVARHYADKRVHVSDRREREHVAERKIVDHGSDRRPSECTSSPKQKRVVIAGTERRTS